MPITATKASEKVALAVYKSPRHDMMYVYLPAIDGDANTETETDASDKADLSVLPAELVQRFGPPVFTLTLDLWPGRKLAQADASVVLDAVASQGFYLQMPPKLALPPTPDELNVHG